MNFSPPERKTIKIRFEGFYPVVVGFLFIKVYVSKGKIVEEIVGGKKQKRRRTERKEEVCFLRGQKHEACNHDDDVWWNFMKFYKNLLLLRWKTFFAFLFHENARTSFWLFSWLNLQRKMKIKCFQRGSENKGKIFIKMYRNEGRVQGTKKNESEFWNEKHRRKPFTAQ